MNITIDFKCMNSYYEMTSLFRFGLYYFDAMLYEIKGIKKKKPEPLFFPN